MKLKRAAQRKLPKQNAFPLFFFFIITALLVGFAFVLTRLDTPRDVGFAQNEQVLGTSQVLGIFDFLKSRMMPSSTQPSDKRVKLPKTSGNREVGNAGALYPYGKTNDSTIVTMPLSGSGGVVEATLSGNITFYLIYPSNLPEGASIELTPYYSMPTAKDSVPLSNELGYGLDILYEAARHGGLPAQMYAVFDLDQGKTIAQIRKNSESSHFCDPTGATFNPQACAYFNNVPLSQHTNQKYGVVAPIRTEKLTHLASLEPTVPIGYDNLIVVPLSKETTLIPQRLSTELLTDLVTANGLSSSTNIYRTEAITHVVEHGLYTPENIEAVLWRYHAGNEYENIKMLYQLPKLQAYVKKLTSGKNLNATETVLAEKISGSTHDFADDIASNIKDLHSNVSRQFHDRNAPEHYITGAALIRRLEKEGYDLNAEKSAFVELLVEDFDYYLEDDPGYVSTMLIAAVILSPKYVASGTFDWLLQTKILAAEEVLSPEEIAERIEDFVRRAKREIKRLCGDDTFAPPSSIELGLKFANMIGDEVAADQCQRKMCSDLDQALSSSEIGLLQEEGKNFTLYFKWCDDSDEKKDRWVTRTLKAQKKLMCITKIQKNLLNFADNRVFCAEVMDENGTIDGYKDDIEAIKQNLRNKNESAPLDMDSGPGYSP